MLSLLYLIENPKLSVQRTFDELQAPLTSIARFEKEKSESKKKQRELKTEIANSVKLQKERTEALKSLKSEFEEELREAMKVKSITLIN